MKALISAAILICLAQAVGCNTSQERLPQRKECIVGVQFSSSGSHASDEVDHGTRETIWSEIVRLNRQRQSDLLVSIAFPKERPGWFFLQLSEACDKRFEIVGAWMAEITKTTLGSLTFEVLPAEVQPDLDTIQVWGPWWRDQPDPL